MFPPSDADPAYAARWVGQFPEGPMRDESQQAVITRWATDDPTAAAGWLATLPDGKGRQDAIEALTYD